jgi:hypothetical protein
VIIGTWKKRGGGDWIKLRSLFVCFQGFIEHAFFTPIEPIESSSSSSSSNKAGEKNKSSRTDSGKEKGPEDRKTARPNQKPEAAQQQKKKKEAESKKGGTSAQSQKGETGKNNTKEASSGQKKQAKPKKKTGGHQDKQGEKAVVDGKTEALGKGVLDGSNEPLRDQITEALVKAMQDGNNEAALDQITKALNKAVLDGASQDQTMDEDMRHAILEGKTEEASLDQMIEVFQSYTGPATKQAREKVSGLLEKILEKFVQLSNEVLELEQLTGGAASVPTSREQIVELTLKVPELQRAQNFFDHMMAVSRQAAAGAGAPQRHQLKEGKPAAAKCDHEAWSEPMKSEPQASHDRRKEAEQGQINKALEEAVRDGKMETLKDPMNDALEKSMLDVNTDASLDQIIKALEKAVVDENNEASQNQLFKTLENAVLEVKNPETALEEMDEVLQNAILEGETQASVDQMIAVWQIVRKTMQDKNIDTLLNTQQAGPVSLVTVQLVAKQKALLARIITKFSHLKNEAIERMQQTDPIMLDDVQVAELCREAAHLLRTQALLDDMIGSFRQVEATMSQHKEGKAAAAAKFNHVKQDEPLERKADQERRMEEQQGQMNKVLEEAVPDGKIKALQDQMIDAQEKSVLYGQTEALQDQTVSEALEKAILEGKAEASLDQMIHVLVSQVDKASKDDITAAWLNDEMTAGYSETNRLVEKLKALYAKILVTFDHLKREVTQLQQQQESGGSVAAAVAAELLAEKAAQLARAEAFLDHIMVLQHHHNPQHQHHQQQAATGASSQHMEGAGKLVDGEAGEGKGKKVSPDRQEASRDRMADKDFEDAILEGTVEASLDQMMESVLVQLEMARQERYRDAAQQSMASSPGVALAQVGAWAEKIGEKYARLQQEVIQLERRQRDCGEAAAQLARTQAFLDQVIIKTTRQLLGYLCREKKKTKQNQHWQPKKRKHTRYRYLIKATRVSTGICFLAP